MGSIFKPSTPAVPPPPPPATYKDEVSGVEQVPVKNPDGSFTYVTRQVKTEEQIQQEAEYKSLMNEALAEIERLSDDTFEHDTATKDMLNTWREEQDRFVDKTFDQRSDVEDASLARRGLTASSAGQAVQRMRMLDQQDAERAVDRDEDILSENIRTQKLNAQQNLYNIASQRLDLDAARTYQSAANGMSSVNAINNYNNNSLMDYYNRQQAASSPSVLGSLGSMFTSSFASNLGSGLGSATAKRVGPWS